MSVSKRLRYEVLRRDNHACRYCGGTAPGVRLTVDHVVPVVLGGTDMPDNLVSACVDCNSGKSATPPGSSLVADVREDALRWAAAQKVAQDARTAQHVQRERHREAVQDIWLTWNEERDLPANFGQSADQFIAAGLTYFDFEEASEVTGRQYRRDPWRYFCGICWGMVAALRESTAAVLEADGAP